MKLDRVEKGLIGLILMVIVMTPVSFIGSFAIGNVFGWGWATIASFVLLLGSIALGLVWFSRYLDREFKV